MRYLQAPTWAPANTKPHRNTGKERLLKNEIHLRKSAVSYNRSDKATEKNDSSHNDKAGSEVLLHSCFRLHKIQFGIE